ncbi:MAG: hypothetical protein DSM106950_01725 [Stigonema ocellatum SAG 48.90 = DSM 106950]|nr:hypothetical protein [Stigonema ocellatum SAG 48.90 = DSM 106950]
MGEWGSGGVGEWGSGGVGEWGSGGIGSGEWGIPIVKTRGFNVDRTYALYTLTIM